MQEIAVSLPVGDAANGGNLYSANGCIGCHLAGAAAPDIVGTYARVEADRLTLEQFAGWTADEYVIASILYPNHYVVDTYIAGVMPQTKSIAIKCTNVAAQTYLTMRLEASAVSGHAMVSDNQDLGFIVANQNDTPITPNDLNSVIPFRLDVFIETTSKSCVLQNSVTVWTRVLRASDAFGSTGGMYQHAAPR